MMGEGPKGSINMIGTIQEKTEKNGSTIESSVITDMMDTIKTQGGMKTKSKNSKQSKSIESKKIPGFRPKINLDFRNIKSLYDIKDKDALFYKV